MRELLRTDIEFTLDEEALLYRLHCDRDDEPYARAMEILEEVRPLLRPAYAVREVPIEKTEPAGFTAGGQRFLSKIASLKLKGQETAFTYIATSGRPISEYVEGVKDDLDQYLADTLAYMCYLRGIEAMAGDLEKEWGFKRYISLGPGSIIDWSVGDVCKIFTLMDGLYQKLGTRVLSSGMIDPIKSTSGVLYPSEEEFQSCSICPRANCPNRRAPFDEEMHNEMANL